MIDRPMITLDTRVADLLRAYPRLEEVLFAASPRLGKLKRPFLRRTFARFTTVGQAAKLAGVPPEDLLVRLRTAAGMTPEGLPVEMVREPPPPPWLRTSPIHESIDADQLLRREENPLARVEALLRAMEPGSVVLVYSKVIPEPLIECVEMFGAEVYVVAKASEQYETYIYKKRTGRRG